MFGQFGQKQYYNMGGPGGPPQRHGQNNQMPFDEQERFLLYFRLLKKKTRIKLILQNLEIGKSGAIGFCWKYSI